MYVLLFIGILDASHVCERLLPDDDYNGQPIHVRVKKNYCAVVGNKNLYVKQLQGIRITLTISHAL
jgi:hypothetical protein